MTIDHAEISRAVFRTASDMIRDQGRVLPFVVVFTADSEPMPLLIPDSFFAPDTARTLLPMALRTLLTDARARMYAICAQSDEVVGVWTGDADGTSAFLSRIRHNASGAFDCLGGLEEIPPMPDSIFVNLLRKETVH